MAEALKHRFNRGLNPNLSFYRDSSGLECDILYETGAGLTAVEVKSGSTVASDYFRALHRVAGIVPRVTAKALVYGGSERQSRSDCEVVPLSDFSGLLERLDFEQVVEVFVRDNLAPEPDMSDINTLDVAYNTQILPVLPDLEGALAIFGGLFRTFHQESYISIGTHDVNSGDLLRSGSWERTKAQHIVSRGFVLSEDRPLNIEHRYVFSDYTGNSETEFALEVSICWTFGSESLSRTVTINQGANAELEAHIGYSELEDRIVDKDTIVAKIGTQIMRQIASLLTG